MYFYDVLLHGKESDIFDVCVDWSILQSTSKKNVDLSDVAQKVKAIVMSK